MNQQLQRQRGTRNHVLPMPIQQIPQLPREGVGLVGAPHLPKPQLLISREELCKATTVILEGAMPVQV